MVNTAIEKNKEHITLKEAAVLSGYSSDYLGQLIRKGKLAGEQVYSNVAWVTTEKDVMSYLQKTKGSVVDDSSVAKKLINKHSHKIIHYFLYFSIGFLLLFIFALFYVFVANVESSVLYGESDSVSVKIESYE